MYRNRPSNDIIKVGDILLVYDAVQFSSKNFSSSKYVVCSKTILIIRYYKTIMDYCFYYFNQRKNFICERNENNEK